MDAMGNWDRIVWHPVDGETVPLYSDLDVQVTNHIVRAFDVHEWFEENKGLRIRRRNGEMVYILVGIERSPKTGTRLILDRTQDSSRTWAPASDASKFVTCNRQRRSTVDAEDQTTPEQIIEHLARRHSSETLGRVLDRALEIEAEVIARKAQQAADAKANSDRRELALKALEKAAQEGVDREVRMPDLDNPGGWTHIGIIVGETHGGRLVVRWDGSHRTTELYEWRNMVIFGKRDDRCYTMLQAIHEAVIDGAGYDEVLRRLAEERSELQSAASDVHTAAGKVRSAASSANDAAAWISSEASRMQRA